MALETDPRKIAIQNHARNLANQDIAIPNRLIFARKFETALQILLSGGTLSADDLAQVDARNLTYPYLEAVRQEGIRCINNPNLTVADFVDPDPNAPVNYIRPSIWSGVPWVARRTNRPSVNGNYNLAPSDLGVVMTAQNSTCFFPPYDPSQDGNEYGVKNVSGGIVQVQANGNESFLIQGQSTNTITIPNDEARQITRTTPTQQLIIV